MNLNLQCAFVIWKYLAIKQLNFSRIRFYWITSSDRRFLIYWMYFTTFWSNAPLIVFVRYNKYSINCSYNILSSTLIRLFVYVLGKSTYILPCKSQFTYSLHLLHFLDGWHKISYCLVFRIYSLMRSIQNMS